MTEQTLTLECPIEFGKRTISELTFKEMTAAEMWEVHGQMKMGDLLKIGASLCGEPVSVMKLLKRADAQKVAEHVGNELAAGI